MLRLGDADWNLYTQIDGELNVAITYLVPRTQSDSRITEQTVFLAVMFLVFCVVFLTWILSVLGIVRNHSLTEDQKEEFSYRKVRRVSLAFVLTGGMVMLAASLLSQCLFRLYDKYELVGKTVDVLQRKITDYEIQKDIAEQTRSTTYEKCVESIAELLSEYPDLKTPEQFQAYCDILGTDYLMLYDGKGKDYVIHPASSLTTSPATISPATAGTNAVEPGISRLPVPFRVSGPL